MKVKKAGCILINKKNGKINKYGLQNYQKYMEKESKSDLYTRFKKMEVKK